MNTAVVLAAAEGIVASKDRLVVVNSIFFYSAKILRFPPFSNFFWTA